MVNYIVSEFSFDQIVIWVDFNILFKSGNPTCTFTKQFQAIYDDIVADSEEYDCNFGSVHCKEFPNVCAHFGVSKLPDIR